MSSSPRTWTRTEPSSPRATPIAKGCGYELISVEPPRKTDFWINERNRIRRVRVFFYAPVRPLRAYTIILRGG
jgi:hypothetical protein